MGLYSVYDGSLFCRVKQEDEELVDLIVVPVGVIRSFKFNGRRYRLSLRKSLLLLYHDSELTGAHSSSRDTLSKLVRVVWWATMERDVHDWISHCSVCRLTKPQPGITIEQ